MDIQSHVYIYIEIQKGITVNSCSLGRRPVLGPRARAHEAAGERIRLLGSQSDRGPTYHLWYVAGMY